MWYASSFFFRIVNHNKLKITFLFVLYLKNIFFGGVGGKKKFFFMSRGKRAYNLTQLYLLKNLFRENAATSFNH